MPYYKFGKKTKKINWNWGGITYKRYIVIHRGKEISLVFP